MSPPSLFLLFPLLFIGLLFFYFSCDSYMSISFSLGPLQTYPSLLQQYLDAKCTNKSTYLILLTSSSFLCAQDTINNGVSVHNTVNFVYLKSSTKEIWWRLSFEDIPINSFSASILLQWKTFKEQDIIYGVLSFRKLLLFFCLRNKSLGKVCSVWKWIMACQGKDPHDHRACFIFGNVCNMTVPVLCGVGTLWIHHSKAYCMYLYMKYCVKMKLRFENIVYLLSNWAVDVYCTLKQKTTRKQRHDTIYKQFVDSETTQNSLK